MAPNFSKNAILEGNVDSFCLVCETYLKSDKEKLNHILQDNHIKNLKTTNYVEEFKEDGIKRIKNKYFCELCNRLLPVLHRVRLHIIETMHLDNKNSCSIKRINNIVVAMEDIVINEQAWHGFSENFCAICNIEYGDEAKHKRESTHIINLIQIKVKFDNEYNLYRKLDEETCQCLTCNMVLASNTISSHFSELEHKNKLKACKDAIKNIHKEKNTSNKVVEILHEVSGKEKNTYKEETINKDAKTKVQLKQVKDEISPKSTAIIDVAKEKKNVTPNKVSGKEKNTNKEETINKDAKPKGQLKQVKDEISPKSTALIDVAKEKKNVTPNKKGSKIQFEYKYDEKSEENIIRILECKDYITRDENNKIWCILCGWIMDPHKIPEHVCSRHHQVIFKMHKNRIQKLKQNNVASQRVDSEDRNIENNEHIKHNNLTTVDVNNAIQQQKVNQQNVHKTVNTRDIHSKVTVDEDNASSLASKTKEIVNKETTKNNKQISKIQRPKFRNIPPPKIPIREFVTNLQAMESMMFKDVLINDRICLGVLNFAFMIPVDELTVRCLACKVTGEDLQSHLSVLSHVDITEGCFVVTQLDLEFIREIHPEEYHCGYCNIVVPCWEDMVAHMNSSSHAQCKNSACWRLQNYRPMIERQKVEQHFKELLLFDMYSRFF